MTSLHLVAMVTSLYPAIRSFHRLSQCVYFVQESEARSFFRQIVSALKYVHEMGYCHRDLKPVWNPSLETGVGLVDFHVVMGACTDTVYSLGMLLGRGCGC